MKVVRFFAIMSLLFGISRFCGARENQMQNSEQKGDVIKNAHSLVTKNYPHLMINVTLSAFLERVIVIIKELSSKLELLQRPGSIDEGAKKRMVSLYNQLRAMLNVDTVETFGKMDLRWLSEVESEARSYWVMEVYHCSPASVNQRKQFDQTKKTLHIDENILFFSKEKCKQQDDDNVSSYTASWVPFIVTCGVDAHRQRAVLYHELGHIVHQDIPISFLMKRDILFYKDIEQDRSLQTGLDRVKHYTELGKSVFDNTTAIGRNVREVLQSFTAFWRPPSDEALYQKATLNMNKERYADLFMLDTLFKERNTRSIISHMISYILPSGLVSHDDRIIELNEIKKESLWRYLVFCLLLAARRYLEAGVVVEGNSSHPADFERALYMAGFLASKGIDVNKAIQKWYTRGKCIGVQKNSALETLLEEVQLSKGARDFRIAYRLWHLNKSQAEIQV